VPVARPISHRTWEHTTIVGSDLSTPQSGGTRHSYPPDSPERKATRQFFAATRAALDEARTAYRAARSVNNAAKALLRACNRVVRPEP